MSGRRLKIGTGGDDKQVIYFTWPYRRTDSEHRRRTDSELEIHVVQIPKSGVGQIPNSGVGQIQLSRLWNLALLKLRTYVLDTKLTSM